MPRFSIIIVTYNSENYIKPCLDSIFKQDFTGYEIILIDNASFDMTLQQINPFKDKLKIIVNNSNKGFSEALNMGIELSKGEYIVTLNPDVILEYNFLSRIDNSIKYIDKSIGMLGVKILRKDTEKIIDSVGLVLSRATRFYDMGSGERDTGQYDGDMDILGPCAAVGIYRREMLEDIKTNGEYFDRDFFYLIEDFDITLRARKRGWSCTYLPTAICYHVRNGSRVTQKCRQYLSFRNRYFLIIKNIKITPVLIFYFITYDMPRWFFLLLTNRHTLRAIQEICNYFPVMLRKRREINQLSKRSTF